MAKILFVHPATDMSIGDVARGYRAALTKQGHDVADYSLKNRIAYHSKALPPQVAGDIQQLSKIASENILTEAMYHRAELAIVVSGLNLHPVALWLLGQVGIPVAVVFTESPYDDKYQAQWMDMSGVDDSKVEITAFTNDRYSSMKYGWRLLAPSYDPRVHRPVPSNPAEECDVLMVGTGWVERQRFLEAVDWTGINLKLYGIWMTLDESSPLFPYYHPRIINNEHVPEMYASAKICLNFHRHNDSALTPGPRCYEIAACGAFQLSDPRPDMVAQFGDSVPTFDSPQALGHLIRYYLGRPEDRKAKAEESRSLVSVDTFDHRAAELMAAVNLKGVYSGNEQHSR